MDIAIHINAALAHQREHGEWLRKGFLKHNLTATVTSSITQTADIHVVSGPWYAKNHWLGHPRVILLDRCYYRGDPEHVSLGWMNERGGRTFGADYGRSPPVIKDARTNPEGTLYLGDYNESARGDYGAFRPHPSSATTKEPLREQLKRFKSAVGNKTTALVDAALMGLEVHSFDPDHIINQPDWLTLLPWADWHYKEIQSGEAWQHLQSSLPPLPSQSHSQKSRRR